MGGLEGVAVGEEWVDVEEAKTPVAAEGRSETSTAILSSSSSTNGMSSSSLSYGMLIVGMSFDCCCCFSGAVRLVRITVDWSST